MSPAAPEPAYMALILTTPKVKKWLADVGRRDPRAKKRIVYMANMYVNRGVVRVHSFQTAMHDYCRFRDYLGMPCPELEVWMKETIVPVDATFEDSLKQLAAPVTVLDSQQVKEWMAGARGVDEPFTTAFEVLVKNRSLGFDFGNRFTQDIKELFEEMNQALWPCPELVDWLKRSFKSDDMRMDQPHVEPPGSTIEDTTTLGTGANTTTLGAGEDSTMEDLHEPPTGSKRRARGGQKLQPSGESEILRDISPTMSKRAKTESRERADTVTQTKYAKKGTTTGNAKPAQESGTSRHLQEKGSVGKMKIPGGNSSSRRLQVSQTEPISNANPNESHVLDFEVHRRHLYRRYLSKWVTERVMWER